MDVNCDKSPDGRHLALAFSPIAEYGKVKRPRGIMACRYCTQEFEWGDVERWCNAAMRLTADEAEFLASDVTSTTAKAEGARRAGYDYAKWRGDA